MRAFLRRKLRGPAMAAFLRRLDIDPHRFWILKDLFRTLSDRRDAIAQLGGTALHVIAGMCFVLMGIVSAVMVAAGVGVEAYLSFTVTMTLFYLVVLLVSECAESLVNPVEGIILAHQPVNGATYTAAKLGHLAAVVIYVVVGVNAVPAIAGTFLTETPWYYAALHMTVAFGLSIVLALVCCSVFGWLLRIVPVRRLKTAAAAVQVLPVALFFLLRWSGAAMRGIERVSRPLAGDVRLFSVDVPGGRLTIVFAAAMTLLLPAVVIGLRSLSADYLIRVSSIVQGQTAGRAYRSSRTGRWVARWLGGQTGRAGFEYLVRMMPRDWQFRRNMLYMLPFLAPSIAALVTVGLGASPFDSEFAPAHLVPQMIGVVVLMVCNFLVFGSDYKGAWVFRQAPDDALSGFSAGVYGGLFMLLVAAPNLFWLPLGLWAWGPVDAVFFAAFSMAITAVYLALSVRLVTGVPFGRLFDPKRGLITLPLMLLGLIGAALMVAVQYQLFRSLAAVIVATAVAAAGAVALGRWSIRGLGAAMRFDLQAGDDGVVGLYREID